MWGAVIGDLYGSIYEYDQVKNIKPIVVDQEEVFNKAFYSDDTILTMANLNAILNEEDYESSLRKFGKVFRDYQPNFTPYFKSSFSPGFIRWLEMNQKGESQGNGAMMRISSIGYLFDTEEEVIEQAKLATIPTHNSSSAIEHATTIALIILWKRQGLSREDIRKRVEEKQEIIYEPFFKFNTTCNDTIGNVLYAVFNNDSYESSVKAVISYGGDTDTNACIVGSMAEVLYGIPEHLKEWAKTKIPEKFVSLLNEGYEKVNIIANNKKNCYKA